MPKKEAVEDRTPELLAEVYNLMRHGDYQGALGRLIVNGRFRLRPKYGAKLTHDAWYAVGDCYSKMGDMKRALVAFQNAYRAMPADRDTLLAIGNCYSEMSDPEFATIYFHYICAQDPHDFEARFNLGNAYMDIGEYELALNSFDLIKTRDVKLLRLVRRNAATARKLLSEKGSAGCKSGQDDF